MIQAICPALPCPIFLKNHTFRLLPQLCHIVDPGSGSPVQRGRGASHPHRNPLYSTVQYSTVQCSTVQYSTEQKNHKNEKVKHVDILQIKIKIK